MTDPSCTPTHNLVPKVHGSYELMGDSTKRVVDAVTKYAAKNGHTLSWLQYGEGSDPEADDHCVEVTYTFKNCPSCTYEPLVISHVGGPSNGVATIHCSVCTANPYPLREEFGLSEWDMLDITVPDSVPTGIEDEKAAFTEASAKERAEEAADTESSFKTSEQLLFEREVRDGLRRNKVRLAIAAEEARIAAEEAEDDDDDVADLVALRSKPLPPRIWLEDGLIPLGETTKLTAASGAGKTVLAANMALSWSIGESLLDLESDGRHKKLEYPLRVLYVDAECGLEWWHDYLERFAAPLETPNLLIKDFPEWAPLTEDAGAAAFWKLFEKRKPDVVILDTLSSFIDGEENSSDTWIRFDNRITLKLKKLGITTVLLDHTGKDVEKGARGNSAKKSKVDNEWLISDKDDKLTLTNAKKRLGGMEKYVALQRVDGPLTHKRAGGKPSGGFGGYAAAAAGFHENTEIVMRAVEALDAAEVPTNIGRDNLKKIHPKVVAGIGNGPLSEAIKYRRERDASLLQE
ncbi:AAA family ATPase [Rhodococcus qingshengii]|jgi:hypothetical protein|nr:hypothetical protein AWH04_18250 [Rhodococcus erythropolis]